MANMQAAAVQAWPHVLTLLSGFLPYALIARLVAFVLRPVAVT